MSGGNAFSPLQPVLLFDGHCALCNRSVKFVLRNERKPVLLFCPLESPQAAGLLAQAGHKPTVLPDSVILLSRGQVFVESEAVIRIALILGGLWKLAAVFFLIPPFFRNRLYRWIARNRFRWFGRTEHCLLVTGQQKARFLN